MPDAALVAPGSGNRGIRRIQAVVAFVLLLIAALLLPALVNGDPILFSDSLGYFNAGEAALDKAAHLAGFDEGRPVHGVAMPTLAERAADDISTARSVYYGIFFNLAQRAGGDWGLALLQAVTVLISLTLALRRFAWPGLGVAALIVIFVALPGGLGLFTATAMPDVFAGLAILALALLLGGREPMSLGERLWWLNIVLSACLFHKSHVAVAAVLIALWFAWSLLRRRRLGVVVAPALIVLLSYAGHVAVDQSVLMLTGRASAPPPFLLARAIGDGTVERYLAAHCPSPAIALCAERHRLPMTDGEFLWSTDPATGLYRVLPSEQRARISSEATSVVVGTLREYPLEQARASTGNFLRQLGDAGATQFTLWPKTDPARTPRLRGLLTDYRHSLIGLGRMPLETCSALMRWVYLGAFAVLAGLVASRSRAGWEPRFTVLVLIVAGVVVNAGVCGVLSGVYDRYQGRVAWLIPFAAFCAWLIVRRPTTSAPAAP